MFDAREVALLDEALATLSEGFAELPDVGTPPDLETLRPVLREAAARLHDNYPYAHPLYAGQMLKPPHPVARIAYALSLWINPNNHALDGGRASSAMEKEAVAHIASMFGWTDMLGHLTSGGTMANLEALYVADSLHPGKRILASDQAHYTHGRLTKVLKIPFSSVPSQADGCMDLDALESEFRKGDVGTVVVTAGTTGMGTVDAIDAVVPLARQYGVRVHADAAYGGYFVLSDALDGAVQARFAALESVDSIVIDPHKHGLQPYGCGCVLFCDPSVGRFYQHDSAYTYFSSEELHLGEISLECSRAGASAVALWATQKLLPNVRGGEFAAGLDACVFAARDFVAALDSGDAYRTLLEPELDIVVYSADETGSAAADAVNRQVFDDAAGHDLHLALIELPNTFGAFAETGTFAALRSVFMKPEHRLWVPQIVERLTAVRP